MNRYIYIYVGNKFVHNIVLCFLGQIMLCYLHVYKLFQHIKQANRFGWLFLAKTKLDLIPHEKNLWNGRCYVHANASNLIYLSACEFLFCESIINVSINRVCPITLSCRW